MEFDSLAFSAARAVPSRENRVYCPACHENCSPEETGIGRDAMPTCPTCGEVTVIRPPTDEPSREVSKSDDRNNSLLLLEIARPSAHHVPCASALRCLRQFSLLAQTCFVLSTGHQV